MMKINDILFIIIIILGVIHAFVGIMVGIRSIKKKSKGSKKRKLKKDITYTRELLFDEDFKFENFRKGYLNFSTPIEMRVGKIARVQAIIAKKRELIKDLLQSNKVEELKIGTLMKLKLIGQNFEIENLTNDSQIILDDIATEWNWVIKAKKAGLQTLILIVSIQLYFEKFGEGFKDHPVLEKYVKVKVNPIYSTIVFIKNNWQWIIGTIISTGIIWKVIESIINK